ncbi:MAG: ATP-binding protein [Campylobacterota bacterium]|nr:ATP-binding protein [Campylobacterota bacterium]
MELRFDFADDDTLAGFRLSHFEFYNWGTFDKSIVSLDLNGHNGLLTGDIGSGKSTIVDALTSLLVPHQKIIYNKAAGAETKERSLYSYVVGEYKSSKDENFGSSKAVSLRDESNFSVLLARFDNEGFDESVTLAQFFSTTNTQVNKFFIVSQNTLDIKKDFFNFKDIRALKKSLRALEHTRVYDSFKEYSKDFRRIMGIKNEQALNLFYQTVSLKSIGNLTSFIRSHMLEKSDIDQKIDELCQNFSELNHTHTLVLRAKRQIELLNPIDKEGKQYEKNREEKELFEQMRNALSRYFATYKVDLLHVKLSELEIELQKRSSHKKRSDEALEHFKEREVALKIELENNGGNRLNVIASEIKQNGLSLETKKAQHCIYNQLAKNLELPTVSNEHRFLKNRESAMAQFESIEAESDKLQNDRVMIGVTQKRYEDNAKELEGEIRYLQNHRSNIPHRISKIRDEMLEVLGLDEDALVFVGELIQVVDTAWEGAIERVLHNFSLSLLVEREYYDAVSAYVDSTNLKGKLVYLKVTTKRAKEHYGDLTLNSLINKIEIKADTPLFEPLQAMLHERFNIPCVDTLSDFRRFKKALSINGQFKSNLVRHEKDDRFDINNRSRWVLGWDNLQKLQKLQEDYAKEYEKISFLNEKRTGIEKRERDIKQSRDDLRDILKFDSFESIDWYHISKNIEALALEKEELEKSSNIIQSLQNQIADIIIQAKEEKVRSDELSKKIGELETKVQDRNLELNEAVLLIDNAQDMQELKERIDALFKEMITEKLNLLNIKSSERTLRETIQNKLGSLSTTLEKSSNKIIRQMSDFVGEFPVVAQDFDASIEALAEFRAKLVELKKDDLPKWQKRFKELFKEKMIQNIVIVQTTLEHQSSEIKSKIEAINRSLKDIEYNEGTFIELIAEHSINMEIRAFQQSLKSSISGAIGDDNVYDEQKFLQIKEIIQRLNGREGHSDIDKKWRRSVTDVRNWFDFSAMERYVSDRSEKEYYAHSGGKSGGQKEKLAYTVLASSLAFQFGLEYEKVQSRSFRFVMIDEAFGRGSDESTRYALKLFQKLNLQLLVITPKQKINVIEPYVKTVHFVHNQDGVNSTLISMMIEAYQKKKILNG